MHHTPPGIPTCVLAGDPAAGRPRRPASWLPKCSVRTVQVGRPSAKRPGVCRPGPGRSRFLSMCQRRASPTSPYWARLHVLILTSCTCILRTNVCSTPAGIESVRSASRRRSEGIVLAGRSGSTRRRSAGLAGSRSRRARLAAAPPPPRVRTGSGGTWRGVLRRRGSEGAQRVLAHALQADALSHEAGGGLALPGSRSRQQQRDRQRRRGRGQTQRSRLPAAEVTPP